LAGKWDVKWWEIILGGILLFFLWMIF